MYKLSNYKCVICLCFKEALVKCINCKKLLCNGCVEDFLNKNNLSCPHCRKENYEREEDEEVNKVLEEYFLKDNNCKNCGKELQNKDELIKHYNDHLLEESNSTMISSYDNSTSTMNQSISKIDNTPELEKLRELEINKLLDMEYNTTEINVDGRNLLVKNSFVNMKNYKDIYDNFDICFRNYSQSDRISLANLEDKDVFVPRKPLSNFLLDVGKEKEPYRYYSLITFPISFPEIRKTIIKSKKSKYHPEYDLFFCGKLMTRKNISDNEICQPGNILCKECMQLNQKYHGLKFHNLINCGNRECNINNNKLYCSAFFKRNNSGTIENVICGEALDDNEEVEQCEACEKIQKNIYDYFDTEFIKALFED